MNILKVYILKKICEQYLEFYCLEVICKKDVLYIMILVYWCDKRIPLFGILLYLFTRATGFQDRTRDLLRRKEIEIPDFAFYLKFVCTRNMRENKYHSIFILDADNDTLYQIIKIKNGKLL